jgi:hypothetical protein
MYQFKQRATISLLIFSYAIAVFIVRNLSQFPVQFSQNQSQVVFYILYYLFSVILGTIASILFLSLEPLIHLLIKYHFDINTVLRLYRKQGFINAFLRLQQYDAQSQMRLVHSVIFQAVLLVIMAYAATSSNSVAGKVLIAGVALQIAYAQIRELLHSKDLSLWFWQVGRVSRQIQLIAIVLMCLFTFAGIALLF